MNTFEKILTEKSQASIADLNEIVADAKLLLASNEAEEIRLLQNIGLSAEIDFIHAKRGDAESRNTFQQQLGKTIVSLGDIQDVCLKYRLYLRKTHQYNGRIPVTLGQELRHFVQDKNIVVGESATYTEFYIVAPPKMFLGYKNALQVLGDTHKQVQREIQARNSDPILLYRIPKTDYFAIVRSWGDDLSVKRKLFGFFTKDRIVNIWSVLAGIFPVFFLQYLVWSALPAIVKLIGWSPILAIDKDHLTGFGILSMALCIISGLVGGAWMLFDHFMASYVRLLRKTVKTSRWWDFN